LAFIAFPKQLCAEDRRTSQKFLENLLPLIIKDEVGHPGILFPHLSFVFIESVAVGSRQLAVGSGSSWFVERSVGEEEGSTNEPESENTKAKTRKNTN
jgi:hypothetical protein